MDPAQDIFVVILTNRTHPKFQGDDDGSLEARGRITDAIMETFA